MRLWIAMKLITAGIRLGAKRGLYGIGVYGRTDSGTINTVCVLTDMSLKMASIIIEQAEENLSSARVSLDRAVEKSKVPS